MAAVYIKLILTIVKNIHTAEMDRLALRPPDVVTVLSFPK